ncbi:helix-turn-helix transcriptional regulator [Bifidobacterium sp. M3-N-101]|uniref:helix-turn-helix domain-containing protein n=1 Tax=Bifidobacterium sp. M3-N-101 TaxID=2949653 RepID=UPI00331569AD
MTAVMSQPVSAAKAQDIVAMNVNLMINARHLQKKDLAKALGIAPQTISKKLRSEITWTINETQAAADFLHTDVATLLNPNLTTSELFGINKTAAPDDSENGGQLVAGHGFEPWTSGL